MRLFEYYIAIVLVMPGEPSFRCLEFNVALRYRKSPFRDKTLRCQPMIKTHVRIAKTNDIRKHQSKHDIKVPKRLSATLHTLTCGKTMKGFQEECMTGLRMYAPHVFCFLRSSRSDCACLYRLPVLSHFSI